ncbi:MFS transporter [Neobacillus mesonae]|uniref:MFS transporter n=1 Tax=Neobacillus mesonae TaxID=1193713 RepID=UPI00203E419E|nr:MFS transporter [Neobacillus mesonae]MCM3567274.1 MFS transporter [Neobacillus mesonae]
MDQARPKLWTKDFIIISAANFFLYLVFYLLLVTIAVYAVDHYHASEAQAGLATGIFIIGTLIGRLAIGRIIESVGNRKTMLFGLIFFILTSCLYFIDSGISFLLFTRLVHGLALGVASTATGTIVAQIIPAERKGEGIGYYSMSTTLATAIGPFIGLFMSQHTSYFVIFSFCLALGVISFIIALFMKVPEVKTSGKKAAVTRGFKISNYIEPKALPIALVTMIASIGYSSVLSFINFYAIEINLVNVASFFFIVYAIAILVSRPVTGRLMDVKGANSVMYPTFILFAAGLFLLSTASNGVIFLLAAVLIGFGFGNIQSCSQAIAVKVTPLERMGLATSTYFIALDAGLGFGPYVIGYIIPLTGYRKLYLIMAIIALVCAVLYYFMHGKKRESAELKVNEA